ncbi:MAG: hypothetical protein U0V70_20705 [Terriglobia bacterium]
MRRWERGSCGCNGMEYDGRGRGLGRGMLQTLGNALSCSRYHNLMQRYADLIEIAIRSNLVDSFGSGVIITGPGWYYLSPTYYAQVLYSRSAGSFPLRLEHSTELAWQLREPDLSATLSSDGKTPTDLRSQLDREIPPCEVPFIRPLVISEWGNDLRCERS